MDILTIEIIIWLVLSFFIIAIPISRAVKKYFHYLKSWIQDIRNIKLSKPERRDTIQKDFQQKEQGKENPIASEKKNTNDQKTEKSKDEFMEHPIEEREQGRDHRSTQKVNVPIIHPHEEGNKDTNKQETSTQGNKQISEREKEKLQGKIEKIKYSAIANKERGKKDLYEKKLIEGLALDPENMNFLTLLSGYYFEERQYIKALSLLKKIVNKDKENHKAIRQIGQVYIQQNQPETAQLLIEKAISLKNDHPKYYITLVEIHYENKELIKAIQTMEKVLKLRPTNTDYLLTMATLYEEAKKLSLAHKYYKKVLEIDPGNAHAKKALKRI